MSQGSPPRATRFGVIRSAAWAPGIATEEEWSAWARGELPLGRDGEPRLEQMPAMLRRHAGRLGRMACDVAYRVLEGERDIPIVFCSRYGEVGRSVDLLTAMVSGESLSPTSFGLSVHNAIGGLFAMARADTANCIALAAGDESAEYGVLEAANLVADGAGRVLVVVADTPLPAVYESFADVASAAFAWAALLDAGAERAMWLEWLPLAPDVAAGETRGRQLPAALSAYRFLHGTDREWVHEHEGHRWRWSRGD